MPGAIERRADQIVHPGVDHQKIARRPGLHVFDARQENASIADDRTPGIEHHRVPPAAERGQRAAHERLDRLRRLILVANAHAAAEIDMAQAHAGRFQALDQLAQPLCRGDERRRFVQQRADVATDADDLERRHAGRTPVEPLRVRMRDAEFGFAQSGRNIRMRARVDIRVDAQRDRRRAPKPLRDARHALQLGFRFEVDAADAVRERKFDFRFGLAHAGKERLGGSAAGGEHARELAARNDIEAGAEPGEQREHRQVRVRLDRVAQHRLAPGQRARELAVRRLDRRARVDVAGRAETPRQVVERRLFGAQHAVAVCKRHYWLSSAGWRGYGTGL